MKFQSEPATTTTTAKPVNFKIFSIRTTDEGYFHPDVVPTAFKKNLSKIKEMRHAVRRNKRPWNSTNRPTSPAMQEAENASMTSTFRQDAIKVIHKPPPKPPVLTDKGQLDLMLFKYFISGK